MLKGGLILIWELHTNPVLIYCTCTWEVQSLSFWTRILKTDHSAVNVNLVSENNIAIPTQMSQFPLAMFIFNAKS